MKNRASTAPEVLLSELSECVGIIDEKDKRIKELEKENSKLRAKKTFEGIEAQYKEEIKLINEIEGEIIMNTAFNGEPPYVGNQGLLLALQEKFAKYKELEALPKKILQALIPKKETEISLQEDYVWLDDIEQIFKENGVEL